MQFLGSNPHDLIKLAKFYPHDFTFEEMNQLPFQLNRYINELRNDDNFKNLRSLAELSMMLVKKEKVSPYLLFYPLFILHVCRTITSYAMILILNYVISIYILTCQKKFCPLKISNTQISNPGPAPAIQASRPSRPTVRGPPSRQGEP